MRLENQPEDVGAIKFPANAHFDHSNIHFFFDEHIKGHYSEKFKVGWHVTVIFLNGDTQLKIHQCL